MTAANRRLFPLVRRGGRPPCLLLPGAGGGVSHYLRLAGHLADRYDVYAVLPLGVVPGTEPEGEVPTMVDSLLDTLAGSQVVPELVFGWSFGGVLAWETCVALREAGYRPDLVIVDSSPLPDSPEAFGSVDEQRIIAPLGPNARPEVVERVLRTFKAQVAALAAYRADRGYDGRVLLQMCAPRDPGRAAAARRWGELAADLTTGWLGCGHFEVFEPERLPRLTTAIDEFLTAGEVPR